MDIALKMVEYLGSEMDYVPWYAARKELSYVKKMVTRSNLYGKFKVEIKKPIVSESIIKCCILFCRTGLAFNSL
jgi:hypothetical protein